MTQVCAGLEECEYLLQTLELVTPGHETGEVLLSGAGAGAGHKLSEDMILVWSGVLTQDRNNINRHYFMWINWSTSERESCAYI